jgi:transposase
MIPLNRRTKVFLCKQPTRMNLSYDGLFHRVKRVLKKDPFSGHLFLFVNRRRNSCKALYYDTTGLVIVGKRMEGGRLFSRANPLYSKELVLSGSEFGLFFEGANLEKRFLDTAVSVQKSKRKSLPFLNKSQRVPAHGSGSGEYSGRSGTVTNL